MIRLGAWVSSCAVPLLTAERQDAQIPVFDAHGFPSVQLHR